MTNHLMFTHPHRLPLVLTVLMLAISAQADSLQFQVVSASGDPVHSAVISAGKPLDQIVMSEGIMDQVDREFSPYVLTIQEGQKVAFPNKDSVRHHVYSFSPAKQFEIRLYSGQPAEPIEFDQSGAVVLGCNIHDNMVGYIYVTRRPYRATTNSGGIARLNSTTDVTAITLWHPNLSLDSQTELTFQLTDLKQITRDDQHFYLIPLDIPTPLANPQAAQDPQDRFSRFKFD